MSEPSDLSWPAEWPRRSLLRPALRSAIVVGFGALLVWTGAVSIGRDEVGAVVGSVLLLAGVALLGFAVAGVVSAATHRKGRLTVVRARSDHFGQDGVAVPGARAADVGTAAAAAVVGLTAIGLLGAPGSAWVVGCVGLVAGAGPLAAAVQRLRRDEALILVPAGLEHRSPSGAVAVSWGAVGSVTGRAPYRGRLVTVHTTAPVARRRGAAGGWCDEEVPAWSGGLPLPVDRFDADPQLVLDLLRRAHADPALRSRLGAGTDPRSLVR